MYWSFGPYEPSLAPMGCPTLVNCWLADASHGASVEEPLRDELSISRLLDLHRAVVLHAPGSGIDWTHGMHAVSHFDAPAVTPSSMTA